MVFIFVFLVYVVVLGPEFSKFQNLKENKLELEKSLQNNTGKSLDFKSSEMLFNKCDKWVSSNSFSKTSVKKIDTGVELSIVTSKITPYINNIKQFLSENPYVISGISVLTMPSSTLLRVKISVE